jgi:hypothetical protein
LFKYLLMSYPDGTIAALYGPFEEESDTTIMKRVLTKSKNLREYLQPGDRLLFDRGFKGKILTAVRTLFVFLLVRRCVYLAIVSFASVLTARFV